MLRVNEFVEKRFWDVILSVVKFDDNISSTKCSDELTLNDIISVYDEAREVSFAIWYHNTKWSLLLWFGPYAMHPKK